MTRHVHTRHVHVDLIGGLAGDMFLAAAVDAGLVKPEALEGVLQRVGLGAVRVCTERVVRHGIQGTRLWFEGWDPAHDHDHRHLSDIHALIDDAALEEGVKARAHALFDLLGRAESEVHAVPMARVHFHEVGAVDSVLDFVGAAWVIEQVGGTWSFGPIPRGQGTIPTSHGIMPAFAPATTKLLLGQLIEEHPVAAELVTPTGAAVLMGLPQGPKVVSGRLLAEGFGAGTRDMDSLANVARMTVYEVADEAQADDHAETILRLSCEIDDMTGEALAHAANALLELGALDVTRDPVTMKKGRLGTRVSVLARPEQRDAMTRALFLHTTTFGVRVEPIERVVLTREHVPVETPLGLARVKVGRLRGEIVQIAAEYEDCAELARHTGRSVHEVMTCVRAAALEQLR